MIDEKTPTVLPNDGDVLEEFIEEYEQSFAPLKENNEAKIIWADENKKEKTAYSIVYLHGFGASRGEGNPWHRAVAQKFGCNLYLSRLYAHGLKGDRIFERFSYKKYISSAIEACRIGQQIGENVLVMGTSAGGALALYVAGSKKCPVPIKGLMLASPLVHIYGYESIFLESKVGRSLAGMIRGTNYKRRLMHEQSGVSDKIWYPYIPIEAALELGKLVEHKLIPSLFKKITCPVFAGYYNKDGKSHDNVVSPHAIESMVNRLGTSPEKRCVVNFTEAQTHVISSGLFSKAVPELIARTVLFLKKIGLTIV